MASSSGTGHDAARRRMVITHTQSVTYDPAAVGKMWELLGELELLDFVRGDEDTSEESRAMTVYEAMGDSSVELFFGLQDDDVGYEVEDYDPDA